MIEGEKLKKAAKNGGLSGGFAGFTAEVTACALPKDWSPQLRGDIAKLAITASSMFTRLDPEITRSVAVNAIDHNFVPMVLGAIYVGGLLWEAYDVYRAYEEGGVEGAIEELAVMGAVSLVGGAVMKGAVKVGKAVYPSAKAAFVAIMAENPGLKQVVEKIGEKSAQVSIKMLGKMEESVTYQSLQKASERIETKILDLASKNPLVEKLVPVKPTESLINHQANHAPSSMNTAVNNPVAKKTSSYMGETNSSNAKVNANKESQVRNNYLSGRKFQEAVHKELRIPENHVIYDVNLPGKGKVGTKPDLPLNKAAVTDVKNVQYITFSKQLQAQSLLAKERGTSFNLIISPKTEKISKDVSKAVYKSQGKIFEFNQETGKFIERMMEENGNKVIR